jgi:hypothetical protein
MKNTGAYTLASVVPTIVNTTERVIHRFSPTDRGCYTDQEFNLKYLSWSDGYRYSMKNCLYSALFEKVFDQCSCVPDYYGRLDNKTSHLPSCRYCWNKKKPSLLKVFIFSTMETFFLLSINMGLYCCKGASLFSSLCLWVITHVNI